jgi:hypothetical protein
MEYADESEALARITAAVAELRASVERYARDEGGPDEDDQITDRGDRRRRACPLPAVAAVVLAQVAGIVIALANALLLPSDGPTHGSRTCFWCTETAS